MTAPASDTLADVAGRRVRIVRGRKSQTVNVCTPANAIGEYEVTYRLRPDVDVTAAELSELADLDTLKAWLLARDAAPEAPGARSPSRIIPRVPAPPPDDPWLVNARAAVERAITLVVQAFTDAPYLHRVEHSLHTQLSEALRGEPVLAETHTLQSGERTQLIHKEWPETIPEQTGPDAAPRGKFDLARLRVRDRDETERLVIAPTVPLRAAYVHVDPATGSRRVKHLASSDVSAV